MVGLPLRPTVLFKYLCRLAVMNLTEMEAKVREATNGEPWGASTSLMKEIANGTYN
jgi:hypothetical protein